jgi:hypothetical protein
MELAAVRDGPPRAPVSVADPQVGAQLWLPAGWFAISTDSAADTIRMSFVDPEQRLARGQMFRFPISESNPVDTPEEMAADHESIRRRECGKWLAWGSGAETLALGSLKGVRLVGDCGTSATPSMDYSVFVVHRGYGFVLRFLVLAEMKQAMLPIIEEIVSGLRFE